MYKDHVLMHFVFFFALQTVVTCMTVLNKTHNDESTASCLVVGTENKALYILDPAAFTYLSRVSE